MRGPALLLAALVVAALPATAKDYGQAGAVFPVVEPDLLLLIRDRLEGLQTSGKLDALNRRLAARTRARVERPSPVPGLVRATTSRRWTYDPTITVGDDVRDQTGRVLITANSRVNPLDTVRLRQRLVFLDGDDPAQIAWALRSTTALDAKLILVNGSPLAQMKAAQRRFYFDQGGKLSAKLGVRAVPAVAEQQGRVLALRELPLARSGASR